MQAVTEVFTSIEQASKAIERLQGPLPKPRIHLLTPGAGHRPLRTWYPEEYESDAFRGGYARGQDYPRVVRSIEARPMAVARCRCCPSR